MSSDYSFIDSSTPSHNDSASQTETRARRISMLMPLLLNLASRHQTQHQDSESESGPQTNTDSRSRFTVIMVYGRTGSMLVMDGARDIETLFEQLWSKSGLTPASKSSIDAMPRVIIHEAGAECAICLEEYEVGSEAREMPCKHKFHPGCIEKWLGIHGSCPMCRFVMPSEKTVSNGAGESEGGEDGGESGETVVNLRLLMREVNSESSDVLEVDVDSDSGSDPVDESVELGPNHQEVQPHDAANDSTSASPEINFE